MSTYKPPAFFVLRVGLPGFLLHFLVLFLTHTGGCEIINTKALTYLNAPQVSSAVRCLHRAC